MFTSPTLRSDYSKQGNVQEITFPFSHFQWLQVLTVPSVAAAQLIFRWLPLCEVHISITAQCLAMCPSVGEVHSVTSSPSQLNVSHWSLVGSTVRGRLTRGNMIWELSYFLKKAWIFGHGWREGCLIFWGWGGFLWSQEKDCFVLQTKFFPGGMCRILWNWSKSESRSCIFQRECNSATSLSQKSLIQN